MNYQPGDRRLMHDGAAICERLDKLIELLEPLAKPLYMVSPATEPDREAIAEALKRAGEILDAAEVR